MHVIVKVFIKVFVKVSVSTCGCVSRSRRRAAPLPIATLLWFRKGVRKGIRKSIREGVRKGIVANDCFVTIKQ